MKTILSVFVFLMSLTAVQPGVAENIIGIVSNIIALDTGQQIPVHSDAIDRENWKIGDEVYFSFYEDSFAGSHISRTFIHNARSEAKYTVNRNLSYGIKNFNILVVEKISENLIKTNDNKIWLVANPIKNWNVEDSLLLLSAPVAGEGSYLHNRFLYGRPILEDVEKTFFYNINAQEAVEAIPIQKDSPAAYTIETVTPSTDSADFQIELHNNSLWLLEKESSLWSAGDSVIVVKSGESFILVNMTQQTAMPAKFAGLGVDYQKQELFLETMTYESNFPIEFSVNLNGYKWTVSELWNYNENRYSYDIPWVFLPELAKPVIMVGLYPWGGLDYAIFNLSYQHDAPIKIYKVETQELSKTAKN
jgi:hypothetical protein